MLKALARLFTILFIYGMGDDSFYFCAYSLQVAIMLAAEMMTLCRLDAFHRVATVACEIMRGSFISRLGRILRLFFNRR